MAIKNTPKSLRALLREPDDYRRPSLFWRATSVFLILSQMLMVDSAMGQVSNPSIVAVSVAPSGACTANLPLKLKTPDGTLWSCQNGTYGQVGGSGGGAVSAVSNSDGTLTISPTTGAVVASLALGHANTWTGTQTMQNLTLAAGPTITATSQGMSFNITGVNAATLSSVGLSVNPTGLYRYQNVAGFSGTYDLGTSRIAAGTLGIGNGNAGDVSGTLDLQQINFNPKTIVTGATPAISTASLQTVTLSVNAAPTVTIAQGERLVLQICQPATGGPFTWTWPASIHGGVVIGTNASSCSTQAFDSFNGTTLVAENVGVINVAP